MPFYAITYEKLTNCLPLFFSIRHAFVKWGNHVGTDKYGNKYYENKYYFFLADRWVIYNPKCVLDYEASMIPPEWHRWMHHSTDKLPTEEDLVQYKWMQDHKQNLTGSAQCYTPYSTYVLILLHYC